MYIALGDLNGRARLKAFFVFQGNTQPPHIASEQDQDLPLSLPLSSPFLFRSCFIACSCLLRHVTFF